MSEAAVPAAVVVVVEIDVVAAFDRQTAPNARLADRVEHQCRTDAAMLAAVAVHDLAAFHTFSSIVCHPPSSRSDVHQFR